MEKGRKEAKEERKEHLKQYILACISESVLSWGDLANPATLEKFWKVISKDTAAILLELAPAAMLGLAHAGISKLTATLAKRK